MILNVLCNELALNNKFVYNRNEEVSIMAMDYVVLNEKSENGLMAVNKSVFESIAKISMQDIEDVKMSVNPFVSPIQVKIEDNKLNITADVKVTYGVNVSATCEKIQNRIYENVSYMTGFKPNQVTVNVTGFEI